MKIGQFIQKHMNEKQINQAELARRSGVPASTISSIIIRNNDRVAIEMILKLCEVLECDIEEYINSLKSEEVQRMPNLFAKKYYSLDIYGREAIDSLLEIEYRRCRNCSQITNIKDSELAVARSSTRNFTPVPTDEQIAMMDEVTPDMLGE